jgi:hypothetical protein
VYDVILYEVIEDELSYIIILSKDTDMKRLPFTVTYISWILSKAFMSLCSFFVAEEKSG